MHSSLNTLSQLCLFFLRGGGEPKTTVHKNERQIIVILKMTDLLYTGSWKAVTRFQAPHHVRIARGQKKKLL